MQGSSMSNSPPLSVSRETMALLGDHYPERLGLVICVDPPFFFQILWKVKVWCIKAICDSHLSIC
jgi:polyribonucleotide 5'-hydroxyl-kinase